MEERNFINDKNLREKSLGRVEVLDKVKEVILLPYGEVMTARQVADYFEVPINSINTTTKRYREELDEYGVKTILGIELINFKNNFDQETLIKYKLNKANRSLNLYETKAIFKLAFLLEESDIAKQIREILKDEYPNVYCSLSSTPAKFKRYEDKLEYMLNEIFGDYIKIEKQIKCGDYYIDYVINELIAIECDEYGHSGYNKKREKQRQTYIENKGYTMVRYNPQKDNLIKSVIPSIMWLLNDKPELMQFAEPY